MSARQPSAAAVATVAASLATLIGCSDFEKPQVIVDLRPLAVVANPAEVVLDVDLNAPSILESVDLSDLVNVEFCGLIADPAAERRINYRFTACEPTRSFRCDEPDDPDDIKIEFGEGSIDDPETSPTEQPMCSTLQVTPVLEALLMKMVEQDPRRIIEGVDVQIELRVETDGPNPEVAYARKSGRYAARLPVDRVANLNPTLDGFTVTRADGSEQLLPLGRCIDIAEPLRIGTGEEIRIEPIVPEGTDQEYVQLDFELNPVFSQEALIYNWLSNSGQFQQFESGGPKDAFGNVPLARTDFSAPPSARDEIEIWITQREERLGGAWFRSCIVVE